MTNKVKKVKMSKIDKMIKEAVLNSALEQYEQLWDNESERSSLFFLLCCGMNWNDIIDENEEYKDFISYIKDNFYTKIEKKRNQFLELWDFDPSEYVEENFHTDLAEGWLVNTIEEHMIETYK